MSTLPRITNVQNWFSDTVPKTVPLLISANSSSLIPIAVPSFQWTKTLPDSSSLFPIPQSQSERKSCHFYLQDISRIQPLLTTFPAILISCLNYCNVLLTHLPASSLLPVSVIHCHHEDALRISHKTLAVADNNDARRAHWGSAGWLVFMPGGLLVGLTAIPLGSFCQRKQVID